MGQILRGTATTTHAIRTKIQAPKASIREIAKQYHINPKTARKWKNRDSVEESRLWRQTGPRQCTNRCG